MTQDQSTADESGNTTIRTDNLPDTAYVQRTTEKRVFHVSEDCSYCPDSKRTWKTTAALEWGMTPCSYCADSQHDVDEIIPNQNKEIYHTLVEIGESQTQEGEEYHDKRDGYSDS